MQSIGGPDYPISALIVIGSKELKVATNHCHAIIDFEKYWIFLLTLSPIIIDVPSLGLPTLFKRVCAIFCALLKSFPDNK